MNYYDLSNIQKLVYTAIQENPDAANDDALLQASVWRKQGFDHMYRDYGLGHALRRVTRAESLSRRKRELRVMGLIEYSEERNKEAMQAFNNEREYAHHPKPLERR